MLFIFLFVSPHGLYSMKRFREDAITTNLQTPVQKPAILFVCNLCSNSFATERGLNQHKDKSHVINQHLIQRCEGSEVELYGVNKRTSNTAEDSVTMIQPIKPYPCEFCPKSYSTGNSRRSHISAYHKARDKKTSTQADAGSCPLCKKDVTQSGGIIEHLYACTVLDIKNLKTYATSKTEKLSTTKKRYPCDVCGRDFSSKNYVREHQNKDPRCKQIEKSLNAVLCAYSNTIPQVYPHLYNRSIGSPEMSWPKQKAINELLRDLEQQNTSNELLGGYNYIKQYFT